MAWEADINQSDGINPTVSTCSYKAKIQPDATQPVGDPYQNYNSPGMLYRVPSIWHITLPLHMKGGVHSSVSTSPALLRNRTEFTSRQYGFLHHSDTHRPHPRTRAPDRPPPADGVRRLAALLHRPRRARLGPQAPALAGLLRVPRQVQPRGRPGTI